MRIGFNPLSAMAVVYCVLGVQTIATAENLSSSKEQEIEDEKSMENIEVYPQIGKTAYRIPSLAVTSNGVVMALSQHRKTTRGDFGNESDIVMRRSLDSGRHFESIQVIATHKNADMHNGPIVVDHQAGRVVVFYRKWSSKFKNIKTYRNALQKDRQKWENWGLGTYVVHSDDDGLTWSQPRLVVIDVPDYKIKTDVRCGNGGNGIQLANGRLVIQASFDAEDGSPAGEAGESYSMLWISDDHGLTWKNGPIWKNNYGPYENAIAQLSDGHVMINQRTMGPYRAAVTVDLESGKVVEDRVDESLPEPICHASFIALPSGELLFSNPSVQNKTSKYQKNTRHHLTVRLSKDDGKNWTHQKLINVGWSGYSCLAHLKDDTILCLFENGDERYDDKISLVRFPLNELN